MSTPESLIDLKFMEQKSKRICHEQLSADKGWKSVLLLQFQPQFQITIIIGILGGFIVSMVDVVYVVANEKISIEILQKFFIRAFFIFDGFYFIELILMIIYKNSDWPEMKFIYPPRHGFIILVELVTLFPVEVVFDQADKFFYILRLRYIFRMIRMVLYLRLKDKSNTLTKTITLTFNLSFVYFFASLVASFIIIPIVCKVDHQYVTELGFLSFIYAITSKITTKGFGMTFGESKFFDYCLCLLTILAFVMTSYFTSKMTCLRIPTIKYKFSFAHKYVRLKRSMDHWFSTAVLRSSSLHACYEKTFSRYFRMFCERNCAFASNELPRGKLPDVIVRDICIDICWDAFQHSHLFRGQETSFLRSLSKRMQYYTFLPDEPVFRKGVHKSCMIYVVTGMIQIISQENGESPILSLSGGTCIGETSLIFDYPSSCTVISKTYSETIILRRDKFAKMYNKFPKICKGMVRAVRQRYDEAKERSEVRNYEKSKYNRNAEPLAIMYIKMTLRRLLHNLDSNDKLGRFRKVKLNFFSFCSKYLDLLSITDDIELIKDTYFVKREFPYIFQPDSILIRGWDFLIGFIACALVLLYPILMCAMKPEQGFALFLFYFISITILWSVDLYVKSSTAVKTPNAFLTSMSKIIYYRLSTPSFIVDLCSIFPLGFTVTLVTWRLNKRLIVVLEMIKLLKVYRLHVFINRYGKLNATSLLMIKYVRVTIYTFLLLYYSASTLYLMVCRSGCSEAFLARVESYYDFGEKSSLLNFLLLYTISSYFINDVELFAMLSLLSTAEIVATIALQIIYCSTYIYLLSDAIATDTVNQQEKHEFKEFATNMVLLMRKFQFEPSLQSRVWSYLMNQYSIDMGMSFLNPKMSEKMLSKDLYLCHQFVMYSNRLETVPLFTYLDDKIMIEVCRSVHSSIYTAGQVITYAGEVCREMYFIAHGQCQRMDRNGQVKILYANDYFSVFELCAGTLNVHTIITLTDCQILSIDMKNYEQILSKYRSLQEEIEDTVNFCRLDQYAYAIVTEDLAVDIEYIPMAVSRPPSFHYFRWYKRKSENVSYFMGFSYMTQMFRILTIRITLTPYGRFLFVYEVCKVIHALVINLLCSSIIVMDDRFFFRTLLALDVLSWFDIYVMHHVCFFNHIGLEIYHPMHTAKHYWRHSFATDLIASLPLDYPFPAKTSLALALRLNRCLQIRRVLGFFNYLNATNISRTGVQDILKYFPLSVLIINYLSLFFVAFFCYIDNIDMHEDECACRHLVKRKMSNSTFSKMNQHSASLLFITSTLAMIGMTRFYLKKYLEMIFLDVLVLFAVVFSIWLAAKMVANNFYRNTDLTLYQQAIKEVVKFFSYRKVDKNIKKEIIDHYEHVWQKKRCKDLHAITSYFSTSFKGDLLYHIFGETLRNSSLFVGADKSVYKSLLLEMEHVVLLKRAIIYNVNDVHGRIFFLLNGQVDVLGPDRKKLIVLPPGSLFGSLYNYPFMRQTLMMVAKSNVELLCINSQKFHTVLSHYHHLYSHLMRLTGGNYDYLENTHHVTLTMKRMSNENTQERHMSAVLRLYCRLNPVYKKGWKLLIWSIFIMVTTNFIGVHMEIYQKVSWSNSYHFLLTLYLLDLLYLINIYMKLHTAYVDEFGMTITSRRKIARNYVKNRMEFYIDVISCIPLETACLLIPNETARVMTFAIARLNRTTRVILLCNTLKNTLEKLDINVVVMRILLICTLLSVYTHVVASILVYIRFSLRVHLPDFYDRLELYDTTMLVVLYVTMGNSINNFTITFNFAIVAFCVLIAIIGRFLITILIAETCSLMESVDKNKNNYKVTTERIKLFLQNKYASMPLQNQVEQYMRLMWIYHEGVQFPQLLENAPYYLREATMNGMFGCHLRKNPILGLCHVDLIRQMAAEMRLVILFPGNCVVHKDEVDTTMYFIHSGIVDALSEDSLNCEVIEHTLGAGDWFGLIQGIHPRYGHRYTYKVREHAIIIILKRKNWFHKLPMFPASEEILSEYVYSEIRLANSH